MTTRTKCVSVSLCACVWACARACARSCACLCMRARSIMCVYNYSVATYTITVQYYTYDTYVAGDDVMARWRNDTLTWWRDAATTRWRDDAMTTYLLRWPAGPRDRRRWRHSPPSSPRIAGRRRRRRPTRAAWRHRSAAPLRRPSGTRRCTARWRWSPSRGPSRRRQRDARAHLSISADVERRNWQIFDGLRRWRRHVTARGQSARRSAGVECYAANRRLNSPARGGRLWPARKRARVVITGSDGVMTGRR